MTRGQAKTNIRVNLADLTVSFYSDDDLNDSIQDAYDDVAALTQCILKTTTVNFQSLLSYYDFVSLGVTDYLGTTAIFNNNSNLWLGDGLSIRDFDKIRIDWETWTGQPTNWAPSDPVRIAIMPRFTTAVGNFTLYYWAVAPTLTADFDVFLIAGDMASIIEEYTTADLLEQAQEFSKAALWFSAYYEHIQEYGDRIKKLAKSDLLLMV